MITRLFTGQMIKHAHRMNTQGWPTNKRKLAVLHWMTQKLLIQSTPTPGVWSQVSSENNGPAEISG